MNTPKTDEERQAYHETIYGKGSTAPSERQGRGQMLNSLLPMPPTSGPPLPRGAGLKWPWKE